MGGGKLNGRAAVQFAWRIVVGELDEECMVEVRCDNACARGIPLPERMRDACRRHRLDKAANDAMAASQSVFGDEVKLACRLYATYYIACAHHEFA